MGMFEYVAVLTSIIVGLGMLVRQLDAERP